PAVSLPAGHPHPQGPTVVYLRTLCFVFHGDRVLLIQRTRDPEAGYWNAPGGKIDRGEDPLDAARRELREETGLDAPLAFRGVATVVVERTGEHWIIFLFAARAHDPAVVASAEGPLCWAAPAEVAALPVLPDIPLLLPTLRDQEDRVILAKFTYASADPATLIAAEIR
ncbi:MAG: NUDIX domain-containing protein, partial [Armatimonadota bacterium]|nr:NUDIX domain-containing protein [Armatimonadota bacterium]